MVNTENKGIINALELTIICNTCEENKNIKNTHFIKINIIINCSNYSNAKS